MLFRLLALVGLLAHVIDRFANFLLGLVGLRLPVVVLLIGALGLLGGLELLDNYRELAARPEPRQASVSEIVEETERGQIIWLRFSAEIVAEPYVREIPVLASGVHELGRRVYFYYLALDPDDRDVGLIVRSHLDDDHFRTRSLQARIDEDPDFVAGALRRLDVPAGLRVDRARFLEEVSVAEPGDDAHEPEALAELATGSEVTVSGRLLAPTRAAACAPPAGETDCAPAGVDDRWIYLLADPAGDTAYLLRSPHPPDAIPVNLQGLVLTDTFGAAPVVESDWVADLRDDLRYPRSRVLIDGAAPPFRTPDWTGVIVMGGTALLLLVSRLVGYPIFRRSARAERVPPLSPGERLEVEMHGRLVTPRSRSALQGALGFVERATLHDLVLALWRYGQVEQGESRRDIERRVAGEAAGRDTRLVVHAPGRSVLATLGDHPVRVETGTVHRVTESRPALRLDDDELDLLVLFEEALDRDRAAGEIAREPVERRP
jgi:hypothetical protein